MNEEKKQVEIMRILAKDIPGNKRIYAGLTLIKGISWSLANAICTKLKINKNMKVGELSKEEIKKIESFIQNPQIISYLMNRQKDFNIGEDRHLYGSDLELQRDFDIKKMKKIKSYKGIRHAAGQPVRGQRTKSHFRKNKKGGKGAVGVSKKGAKRQ